MTAGLSLLLAATASAAASPKIFWVSEPVVPGETALVAFSQPAAAPALALLKAGSTPLNVTVYAMQGTGAWAALETSGSTLYGCAAKIPSTFAVGEFEVKIGPHTCRTHTGGQMMIRRLCAGASHCVPRHCHCR